MTLTSCLLVAGLLFQGPGLGRNRHMAPLSQYLSLALSSARGTYHRGEALQLRVTARNTSDVPVTAFLGFQPWFRRTTVYYRVGGTGEFVALDVNAQVAPATPDLRPRVAYVGPTRKTLHPGQQHSGELSISVVVDNGIRRFVLDRLGRYEFKVRHADTPEDPNGLLESDVLAVEVLEPPASERVAQAAYTPDLAAVASGGPPSPQVMRAAAAFLERFSDSMYSEPLKTELWRWLGHRVRSRRASMEERRLYETLTARVDQTPYPNLRFAPSIWTLWPADDAMVPISVRVVVRNGEGEPDAAAQVALVSITCDDSCDLGTNVAGATFGTDDREFEVRASRGRSGAGRRYTITYSATNSAGKQRTDQQEITVPHDQTPPPWTAQHGLYKVGDPVTYKGEAWRCVETHPPEPQLAPDAASISVPVWVKVRGEGSDSRR